MGNGKQYGVIVLGEYVEKPLKKLALISKSLLLLFSSAGVAQLVEQLICNQPVAGSSPVASFRRSLYKLRYFLWLLVNALVNFQLFVQRN